MVTLIFCLVVYIAVCAVLTVKCRKWKAVPWIGYLLTAVPFISVWCCCRGYTTAFVIVSVICGIAGLLAGAVVFTAYLTSSYSKAEVITVTAAEVILTALITLILSRFLQDLTLWHKILLGASIGSVFCMADFSYALCDFEWGLKHMNN